MAEFVISVATVEDTELLVKHRIEMFIDILPEMRKQAQDLEVPTREWIKTKLLESKLIGFIVKTQDSEVVGSGCIWLRNEPPRIFSPDLESPYLMSIYTEKGFRQRGVASIIVKSAIDWCKQKGFHTISLHASEAGIPIYAAFGFKPTSEMRLSL